MGLDDDTFSLDFGGDAVDDTASGDSGGGLSPEELAALGIEPGGDGENDENPAAGGGNAANDDRFAAMQRRMAEQDAELAALRAARNDSFDTSAPQRMAPAAPSGPQMTADQIKQQLAAKFIADPGGAMLEMYQHMDTLADQKARALIASRDGTSSSLVVDAYKSQKAASDPDFSMIAGEFESTLRETGIEQQLAGLDRAAQQKTLDFLYERAEGRTARAARAARRSVQPPNYTAGAVRGSAGGGVGLPSTIAGKKMTDEQKEVLLYIKENNIKDPIRIANMLLEAQ